jgi:hypothetical protein
MVPSEELGFRLQASGLGQRAVKPARIEGGVKPPHSKTDPQPQAGDILTNSAGEMWGKFDFVTRIGIVSRKAAKSAKKISNINLPDLASWRLCVRNAFLRLGRARVVRGSRGSKLPRTESASKLAHSKEPLEFWKLLQCDEG